MGLLKMYFSAIFNAKKNIQKQLEINEKKEKIINEKYKEIKEKKEQML